MESDLKKTIIFPIEIADRELHSKSLLAKEIANKDLEFIKIDTFNYGVNK